MTGVDRTLAGERQAQQQKIRAAADKVATEAAAENAAADRRAADELNAKRATEKAALARIAEAGAAKLMAEARDSCKISPSTCSDAFEQNALGEKHENGTDVEKDIVKAKAWYQKAVEQGFRPARANLKRLEAIDAKKAIADAIAKAAAGRDPKDIVAQVLNYSEFGKDEGGEEDFANPFDVEIVKIPIYWSQDSSSKCRYVKASNRNLSTVELKTLAAPVADKIIDLNQLDPRLIKFGYQNGITAVVYDSKILTSAFGQIDLDRLQRGWTLIYSKYCSGKQKAF